jgi:hypothetical protein
MDVGERLDALENRLAVIERALKITPPSADVTITPPGPRVEERLAVLEDQLSRLEEDMGEISVTAGKIKELSGKKGNKK